MITRFNDKPQESDMVWPFKKNTPTPSVTPAAESALPTTPPPAPPAPKPKERHVAIRVRQNVVLMRETPEGNVYISIEDPALLGAFIEHQRGYLFTEPSIREGINLIYKDDPTLGMALNVDDPRLGRHDTFAECKKLLEEMARMPASKIQELATTGIQRQQYEETHFREMQQARARQKALDATAHFVPAVLEWAEKNNIEIPGLGAAADSAIAEPSITNKLHDMLADAHIAKSKEPRTFGLW